MAKPPRIFISHVDADGSYAADLKRALVARGMDAWTFEDVARVDESLDEALRRALQRSHAYVAIVSDRALASNWIPFEVGAAFSTGKNVLLIDRTTHDAALPAPFSSFRTIQSKRGSASRAADEIAQAVAA
jgi:hypothetical protein